MSKNVASRETKTPAGIRSNGGKTSKFARSTVSSKLVGGFIVFGTPIQPKHLSRAQIAEAIDRLR
jgi:hypothetical protein